MVGFSQNKKIRSTDLSVPSNQVRDDFNEYIQDGGKLRPLDKDEQKALIITLQTIDNIEMTLAFLIALTSGARIQTVFTLRLKHIQTDIEGKDYLPIFIGKGTGVDSKYQKRMKLLIPSWLHKKLYIYSKSERAIKRRQLSKHGFSDEQEQYAFLTRTGKPYYIAENDPLTSSYVNSLRGGAVREFISSYLEPNLKRLNAPFRLKFHDLRATYGMNLLEEKIELVERGKGKLFDVLMLIKTR